MLKISKINLVLIFIIIFVLLCGLFAIKWAQEERESEVKNRGKAENKVENERVDVPLSTNKEVTILTDKKEYRSSEVVKIIIKNNSNEKIFIWMPEFCNLRLQKYDNNEWNTIEGLFPRCCGCGVHCESLVNIVNPGKELKVEWDQVVDWCEDTIYKRQNVSQGKYRFIFGYSENKKNLYDGIVRIIPSNSFVIR